MVWCLWTATTARDRATEGFNAAEPTFSTTVCVMGPDVPLQVRPIKSALAALRFFVSESWGFPAGAVKYGLDTCTLSVGGLPVLRFSVRDFVLDFQWIQQSWATWSEMVDDTDFQAILKGTQAKLDEASKRVSKGKGKGALA